MSRRNVITAYYAKTYDVDESDDPEFLTGVTNILSDVKIAGLQTAFDITKKYIRIKEKTVVTFKFSSSFFSQSNSKGPANTCSSNCGGLRSVVRKVPNFAITSITNTLAVGGRAELSFEILGSGKQWIELISADEIGTVTYGEHTIKEVVESVSNHVLPSSQSLFRAVLKVAGYIETGVSIIKVA